MARTKQNDQRKLELLEQLKQQRDLVTGSHLLLRDQLNVSKIVQGSIKKNPKRWFQGGIAAGLGATLLLKRPKKKPARKAAAQPFSVKSTIIKYVISALKPVITNLITTQVKTHLSKKQSTRPFE